MAVFQPWKRKEILQPHSQETGRPINRPITSLSALFTRPLQTVLPRSILPGRISCWAPSCSGTGSFRYFESSRLRETEMMIYPSNNRIRAENLQILSGVHISLANWKKWREREFRRGTRLNFLCRPLLANGFISFTERPGLDGKFSIANFSTVPLDRFFTCAKKFPWIDESRPFF